MRKIASFFILLSILMLGVFVFAKQRTNKQKTPKVAATIFPIFDILRNVTGNEIRAVLILPPGASPHTFDVSPSDIKNLAGSDCVFAISHGLDDWVLPLTKNAEVKKNIIVDKNIALQQFANGTIDPHYFLSIPNAILITRQMRDELGLIYPEKAFILEANANAFIQKLNQLDQEIKAQFAALPNREIAAFHSAWNYFAAEYSLNIVATFEEFPGKEPTPKYLSEFQEKIKKYNVKVIFSEPQFSTVPLQATAKDLGATISTLDPIGGVAGRESYEEMMRYNGRQIVDALVNLKN